MLCAEGGKPQKLSKNHNARKHIKNIIFGTMTWKHCASILFVFLFVSATAQVTDDFSDGDFTSNPAWSGDAAKFLVNGSFELQSNGNSSAGDTLALSTANALMDSTEFLFRVKLDFNPSSTNYTRVYLSSNNANLRGSLNGYYLQLGETGTSDTIKIFRQTGTSSALVFAGNAEVIGSSSTSANITFRIARKAGGNWEVYADKNGGNNYALYGSFTENTYTTTAYFGFFGRYTTASRFNMYHFDDVLIREIVGDTTKPFVQNVSIASTTQLDVLFSENIETATAQNVANFSVNNGIGSPSTATVDANNKSLVHLAFANPFVNASSYSIAISNVKDLAGNAMNAQNILFNYFVPSKHDLIINELMADPDPKVGLPAVEFIELYNRSAFAINVNGWKFSDASSTITLPAISIPADSFAIIVRNDSAQLFQALGAITIGVGSLPSLNNDKDSLTLKDAAGNTIHSVVYSDEWYADAVKKNGGYTLELINPHNLCLPDANNWLGSNDVSGGTPGKKNSNYNAALQIPFIASSATIVNQHQIQLTFSQAANAATASNPSNYSIDNGIGNPATAVFDTIACNIVLLTFIQELDSTILYNLNIQNISNCAGVVGQNQILQLVFSRSAERFDIVINEVMADPDPVVQLPNYEYIELYNRSNKAISLKDWKLGKVSTQTDAKLSDVVMLPNTYLVVCGTSAAAEFANFTYPMAVTSFPSLTNAGDKIYLKDAAGNLIHYIEYSDTWYKSNVKKSGGWALEMIDANNPCSGNENWAESENSLGGTPGTQNSVAKNNPDALLPNIARAALVNSTTLGITFTESLDSAFSTNVSFYSVNNGVGNPANIQAVQYDFKRILLQFAQPFQAGIIYTIKVNGIKDCIGNSIGINDTARFAVPDTINREDIVINEILFNPTTSGVDYLEIYNRSNKIFDLSKIVIEERDVADASNVLEASDTLAESLLMFPKDYLVFTSNPSVVANQYHVKHPELLVVSKGFPNFPDNEGIAVLKLFNGSIIDSFYYSDKWQYPLIDDRNGVALERIDFNKPTNAQSNWHSAASDIGFGTPTYLNSQFYSTGIADDAIVVEPEVFSPDNDGIKDFTLIRYKFTEAGYRASIRIFDAVGREIKYLVKAELLGAEGEFQWDGTDNDNQKARTGIYTAMAEIFNLQGKVKRFKKNVVLGAQLD